MHLRTLIAPIALGALLLSAGCSFHASVGSRTSGDAATSQSRTRTRTASRTRVTRRPRVTRASSDRTSTAVVRRPTSQTGQAKGVVRANPTAVAKRTTKPTEPVYAQSPEDLRRIKEAEEALAKVRAEKAAADAEARKRLELREQELAAALQATKDAQAKAAEDMARIQDEHAAELARIKEEHALSLKKLEEEEAAEDGGDSSKVAMRRMVQTKNDRVAKARELRRKQLEEDMKRRQEAAATSRTSKEEAVSVNVRDAQTKLQTAMRKALSK